MPYEILFNTIEEAVEKVKTKIKEAEECRIKENKDNIKVKIRTKKQLYTLVFTPEKLGVKDVSELKSIVDDFTAKINCKNKIEIGKEE